MSNYNYFKYLIIIILFMGFLNASTCVIKKMSTGIEVFGYWDDDNNKLDLEAKLSYINFDTGQRTSLPGKNLIFNITVFKNDDSNETITRTVQTDSMGWGRRTFYLDDVKEYQVLVEYEGESNFKPSTGTIGGGGEYDEKKYTTNLPEGISLVSCLPILILFGFLGAAMYASGGNPFGFVDLTTTRGFRMNRNLRKMMMLQSAGSMGAQMLQSIAGGLGAIRKALTKLEGATSTGTGKNDNSEGKKDIEGKENEQEGKVNMVGKGLRKGSGAGTQTPKMEQKGTRVTIKNETQGQTPKMTKGTPKTYEGLRRAIDVLSGIASILTFDVVGGIQGIGASTLSSEQINKKMEDNEGKPIFFTTSLGMKSERDVSKKIEKLREKEKIQSMSPKELKEHLRLIKMNAQLEKETNKKTIEKINEKIEKLKKTKNDETKGINKLKMRWQLNILKSKKEILNRKNEMIDKKDLDITNTINKIDELYKNIEKTGDFEIYNINIKDNNLIYFKNFSEMLDKDMDIKIDIDKFKNEIKKMEKYSEELTEKTLEINSNVETNVIGINNQDIETIKKEIQNKNKDEEYSKYAEEYVKKDYDNIIDKMIDKQEYSKLRNLGVDEILISDYVVEKKFDLAKEFRESYNKINPQNRDNFEVFKKEKLEEIKNEIMYNNSNLLEGYNLSKIDRKELDEKEIEKVDEYEQFISKIKMPVHKAENMFSTFDEIYKEKEKLKSNVSEIDNKIKEFYKENTGKENKKFVEKIKNNRKKVEDKMIENKIKEDRIIGTYQATKLEKPKEYVENLMKVNYFYTKNINRGIDKTLEKINKNERIYEVKLNEIKKEISSTKKVDDFLEKRAKRKKDN